jgi:hypothetical protein
MSNFNEDQMLFNFKDNGDVFTMINGVEGEYVGRIDSEGDWRPSDDCQFSEEEIRDDLSLQVEFFNDWVWPVEFLTFLGTEQ